MNVESLIALLSRQNLDEEVFFLDDFDTVHKITNVQRLKTKRLGEVEHLIKPTHTGGVVLC
jgi:hypothetical protein